MNRFSFITWALPLSLSFSAAVNVYAAPDDLAGYVSKDFLLGTAETGCQPKGMKADQQGKKLYVAEMCGRRETLPDGSRSDWFGSASIYDIATRGLESILKIPNGNAQGIIGNTEAEMSEDNRYALISRAEGPKGEGWFQNFGMVSVVDVRTNRVVKYIPVKGRGAKTIARRPLLSGDSQRRQVVYVANYFSDDISVLDITNLRPGDVSRSSSMDGTEHFVTRISLKSQFANYKRPKAYYVAPRGMAFTPDGKHAVVLATDTGSLMIIDSVNHKMLVELAPIADDLLDRRVNVRHIVTTQDGRWAYLSHMRGNAISRIDLRKLIQLAEEASDNGQKVLGPDTWKDIFVPFNTPTGRKSLIVLENYPSDHPGFVIVKDEDVWIPMLKSDGTPVLDANGNPKTQLRPPSQAYFNRKPREKRSTWSLAHPNTIVLDPVQERYLFISHRTTTYENFNVIDNRLKGKVDIFDTWKGRVVFTLVSGAQPTALEVTPDRKTLISAGFKDATLYFFDLEKIIQEYEK